jgi:uncharacterized protein (DUF2141 family)
MNLKAITTALICLLIITLHSSFNISYNTITIEVTNLKSNRGSVLVSLYDNAKYFPQNAAKAVGKTKAGIQNGVAVAKFTNIPAGTYAAAILHDANDNLKMDFNIVGMPKEGYGFSNNARGTFGPPSFDKAAFKVTASEIRVSIKAAYFFK